MTAPLFPLGPWLIRETTLSICRLIVSVEDVRALEISHESYGVIAYLPYPSGEREREQSACAHLIAASPDLYEIAQTIRVQFSLAGIDAREKSNNPAEELLWRLCSTLDVIEASNAD